MTTANHGYTRRILRLFTVALLAVTVCTLKLNAVLDQIPKTDLSVEARYLAAALSEAQSHVLTSEVKAPEIDFRTFLQSKVLRRLQGAIDRWTLNEDRLRQNVQEDSFLEIQMFDDSIVSLASGKSLLGYIYWRTKQDAVALQLLEGSCPLLWEYHSAIKSPDSYSWLDCYITLRDLYSQQDEVIANNLEASFQLKFPWIDAAVNDKNIIKFRLRPKTILEELSRYSRSDLTTIAFETRRGWAIADEMRGQLGSIISDFVSASSIYKKQDLFYRATTIVDDMINKYETESTLFDVNNLSRSESSLGSTVLPHSLRDKKSVDILDEFTQLTGRKYGLTNPPVDSKPHLRLHRLREEILVSIQREANMYVSLLSKMIDSEDTNILDVLSSINSVHSLTSHQNSKVNNAIQLIAPMGYQSITEVIQVFKYYVRLQNEVNLSNNDKTSQKASSVPKTDSNSRKNQFSKKHTTSKSSGNKSHRKKSSSYSNNADSRSKSSPSSHSKSKSQTIWEYMYSFVQEWLIGCFMLTTILYFITRMNSSTLLTSENDTLSLNITNRKRHVQHITNGKYHSTSAGNNINHRNLHNTRQDSASLPFRQLSMKLLESLKDIVNQCKSTYVKVLDLLGLFKNNIRQDRVQYNSTRNKTIFNCTANLEIDESCSDNSIASNVVPLSGANSKPTRIGLLVSSVAVVDNNIKSLGSKLNTSVAKHKKKKKNHSHINSNELTSAQDRQLVLENEPLLSTFTSSIIEDILNDVVECSVAITSSALDSFREKHDQCDGHTSHENSSMDSSSDVDQENDQQLSDDVKFLNEVKHTFESDCLSQSELMDPNLKSVDEPAALGIVTIEQEYEVWENEIYGDPDSEYAGEWTTAGVSHHSSSSQKFNKSNRYTKSCITNANTKRVQRINSSPRDTVSKPSTLEKQSTYSSNSVHIKREYGKVSNSTNTVYNATQKLSSSAQQLSAVRSVEKVISSIPNIKPCTEQTKSVSMQLLTATTSLSTAREKLLSIVHPTDMTADADNYKDPFSIAISDNNCADESTTIEIEVQSNSSNSAQYPPHQYYQHDALAPPYMYYFHPSCSPFDPNSVTSPVSVTGGMMSTSVMIASGYESKEVLYVIDPVQGTSVPWVEYSNPPLYYPQHISLVPQVVGTEDSVDSTESCQSSTATDVKYPSSPLTYPMLPVNSFHPAMFGVVSPRMDLQDPINMPSYEDYLASVRSQIEYYFSPDNLNKDKYLRSKMDNDGYVKLDEIFKFRRIQMLQASPAVLLAAARSSVCLELAESWAVKASMNSDQDINSLSTESILQSKVRCVDNPTHWILTKTKSVGSSD